MKKIVAIASAAALMSVLAMPTMAAEKAGDKKPSAEETCKAKAEKDKVAADKMDAYVKTCVEKHSKKK